jgi:hypothetical protein
LHLLSLLPFPLLLLHSFYLKRSQLSKQEMINLILAAIQIASLFFSIILITWLCFQHMVFMYLGTSTLQFYKSDDTNKFDKSLKNFFLVLCSPIRLSCQSYRTQDVWVKYLKDNEKSKSKEKSQTIE